MLDVQERDPIERVRKLILAHDIAAATELKVLLGSTIPGNLVSGTF